MSALVGLLTGMRVVELASFIAAPLAGLQLAQLGAEVIRIDPLGGGPDRNRWPLASNGESLYWQGLNKGKKSVALDLRSPIGRKLVRSIVSAPGQRAGLLLTNFPAKGWASHDQMSAACPNLITARVMGWADGTAAVDYTVNAATGIPMMTGPDAIKDPINHVLPSWDLMTGMYTAFALLAAESHRLKTGEGQEIRIPLGDMAIATLGNLGQIAETLSTDKDRPRYGNDLFGATGRDFRTRDGRSVMIVALTDRQWTALVDKLNLSPEIEAMQRPLETSLAGDPGLRFQYRSEINAILVSAIAKLTLDQLSRRFAGSAVCWDVYQTLHEALTTDPRFYDNPVLSPCEHAAQQTYPTPTTPGSFSAVERSQPLAAPRLGQHTEEILASIHGITPNDIIELLRDGVIQSATAT